MSMRRTDPPDTRMRTGAMRMRNHMDGVAGTSPSSRAGEQKCR